MTTPGSNLFLAASRLIVPTQIQYYAFTSRAKNAARQYVPSFADPVTLSASVQAVSRKAYKLLGLDFNKKYIKLFAAENVIDVGRDTSGDKFVYNGHLYQVDTENSWFLQDGWVSCIAVDTGVFSGTIF